MTQSKRPEGSFNHSHSDKVPAQKAPWYDGPFMKACRREPCDVTPVWLMRQAGRYMAEYREVRAKTSFLGLCKNPALCSEVMCTAVNKLGVDAAIIFSDLLPILEPMGLDLEFAEGEGPIIHNPVREASDVDRVLELEDLDSLDFVMETVRQTRNDLPDNLPLIGFAGAPFTLASYVIEGGGSRHFIHTKALMFSDDGAWRALMEPSGRKIIASPGRTSRTSLYPSAVRAADSEAIMWCTPFFVLFQPKTIGRMPMGSRNATRPRLAMRAMAE